MTGYQSKKAAASAKTIDEVNWADHEPDGLAQPAQGSDTYRSVPHGHCTHPKCKEVFIAYIEANKRLAHYEPEGKSPMLLNTSPPQPAQEPKSVTFKEVADTMNALRKGNFSQKAAAKEIGKLKLYTAPPQRTWVGLTDDERYDCVHSGAEDSWDVALLIEAKLKEKNNGT